MEASEVARPAGVLRGDPDGAVPDDLAGGVLAKAARENFPVAPRFLPRAVRRDLMAVYGFARLVDDLGDEAVGGPAERERLLDLVDADLDRIYAGRAPLEPLLARLVPTVTEHDLPVEPFRRLVLANRVDQRVSRYDSFEQLVDYCRLSANPVGELVLGVFGAATPDRVARSDDVCTALQLAEHWQDVAEDARRGRVYLPGDDLAAFGVGVGELTVAPASDALRRLMAFEVRRAHELFDRGGPLVGMLAGSARLAVAAFVAGGRAALAAVSAADYDVVSATRRPSRRRALRELVAALRAEGAR